MPLSSIINSVGNLISNAQQNSYNRDLAEYQNAFNLEMWNRQNEYNSPIETMKRLTEAGINPRNVNGLQTFSNATQGPQAAQYEQKAPLSAFSDIARTALEFRQMRAMTEKLEAEKLRTATQTATEQARALDYLSQIDYRKHNLSHDEDRLRLSIIDGLRKAWHEGDTLNGTGIFNTFLPELTFDQETYGIEGLKRINQNEEIHLRNLGESLVHELREQQKIINANDIKVFNDIPGEWRWIIELLIHSIK